MNKIKEMGRKLIEGLIKLSTSDTTSAYYDKGYGFTLGGLTAIGIWISIMWIMEKIISIIEFPFKVIKKLLKK